MPSHNDKGGRDGDESNEDIDILRKEYRNMQANRNAFAHESDLVSHVPSVRNCHSLVPTIVASRISYFHRYVYPHSLSHTV